MAVFKCKMCGAQLEVEQGSTVATCAYCGSKQTVANADDERKEAMFNRANELRMRCEFDKALLAYQSILTTFPNEPEAHWGIAICRYGIEYVDDPITKTKKPTIHRASYDSILKDSDYLEAISRADVIARELYQQQAKEIADIQTSLLAISQKEEPFDIFICYKETDEKGKRTPDSVLAQEIYGALTDRGYKVFFARITLENKLGVMYEPYIFAALNSAKIMLVIGTKKEYFEAVWVKNEWSRYLDLMRTRPDRHLIPCYRDIVAYEMPEEFLALQAQDLSKLGFLQDLNRGIDKIMGKNTATPAQTTKVIQPGVNVDALLTRAEILIGDGDFQKADALLERVLDNDPRSSQAYLLKLLIELEVVSIDELKNQPQRLDGHGNFKKAYDFGDKTQKERLDAINDWIDQRNEEDRLSAIYKEGMLAWGEKDFLRAASIFGKIPNYRDAKKLSERMREEGVEAAYMKAVSYKENGQFESAVEEFSKIVNYKDSEEQIAECEELKKKASYDFACRCRDSGEYDKAIRLFSLHLSYSDSELQIENCKKLKAEAEKEAIYQSCVFGYKINDRAHQERLRKACVNLAKIPGYKDADQLLVQYEGVLKELENRLAKEEEERAIAKAKAVRKTKRVALISGVSILAISALALSVAFIFVPNGKIGQSKQLLEDGRYSEALNILKGLGPHTGYQETIKLARMCNAGISFQNKEYERGIDYVYNAGGTVDITYDANGGQTATTSQTIKGIDYVNNTASKDGYTFKGWTLYSFSMKPSEYYAAITLRAEYQDWDTSHGKVLNVSSDGKTITYGLYPQKHVIDQDTIAALNSIDAPDSSGWYLLNGDYYAKRVADVRPLYNIKYSDGSAITNGSEDWFLCEPIEWNVLSSSKGEAFVVSKLLLDLEEYGELYYSKREGVYANNYAKSSIRKWLNEDFLSAAFSLSDSELLTTVVDNSGYGALSCENTYDKLFLLSSSDYANSTYGFVDNKSRSCKTTDWARANQWLNNDAYWTRTPDYSLKGDEPARPSFVDIITTTGAFGHDGMTSSVSSNQGVRVGATLKLPANESPS